MTKITVNGNTYSDDGTSSKDLQNGGHRNYLLPMISDTVADTAAKVAAAGTQASNAASSASAAASSAATAANAPGTNATSTTSLTIGIGAQSLTIQSGKLLVPGMPVVIANTASPSNYMAGSVTSYNSGTGALVVNVTNISGSGTAAAWTVSLTGVPGVTGVLNELKAANIASAATVNLDAATGNLVHITGTTGITAFTLAAGSRRTVVFDDVLTITNSANVQCPAGQNITTAAGDMCTIYGDGAGVVLLTDYIRKNGLANVSPGIGGTTITGNITLTNQSPSAIVVTPSRPGLYATEADATTMVRGVNVRAIYNAGEYDYGYRDSTGKVLGWVRPGEGATVSLADNSTAAGVWATSGMEKLGITANYYNAAISAVSNSRIKRVDIDSNRTMLIFGSTTCYAIIYDASTGQWGAPTSIYVGILSGQYSAVLTAANQVLIVTARSNSVLDATVLTLSGTSISPNAPVSLVSTSATSLGQLIVVGAAFVLAYAASSVASSRIVALSVSGTTPAFGAEVTIASAGSIVPAIYAVGSVVRTFTQASGSLLQARPYTLSGLSLSPGTLANGANGMSSALFRSFVNGNGNVVVQYDGGITVFRLSGTTELQSTVSIATPPSSISSSFCDVVQIGSNKALFMARQSSGTNFYFNLLTDNAGTASIGSELSVAVESVLALVILGASGSFARAVGLSSDAQQYLIDCSGSSPLLSSVSSNAGSGSGSYFSGSNYLANRSSTLLSSGTTYYAIQPPSSTFDFQFTPNSVKALGSTIANKNINGGIAGNALSESWISSVSNNGSIGFNIKRVECAA